MGFLKSLYLATYNGVLCLGWTYIVVLVGLTLLRTGTEGVYSAVEKPLLLFQTAALLEIVHSLLGIVRAPLSATLPQVASRIFLTWGLTWSVPEVRQNVFVTTMVSAWSITEVIRYGFFAFKEALGGTPFSLLWLRYSSFLPLYPIGMVSEIGCIMAALPFIKVADMYSYKMPNKINFAFDYYVFSVCALLLWAPGCPYMYTYMLSQRNRALWQKTKTH